MPGDSPTLLGMLNIKLLNILKITGEGMLDLHKRTNFDLQTMEASNGPSCKTNKAQPIRIDNVDAYYANANSPYYLRSSINRAADKRPSQVLTNSVIFFKNRLFEGTFSFQMKDDSQPYQVQYQQTSLKIYWYRLLYI